MSSEDAIRRKLTQLKSEEAKLLKDKSGYEAKASQKRSEAAKKTKRSRAIQLARN